jgi:hypothetical protein
MEAGALTASTGRRSAARVRAAIFSVAVVGALIAAPASAFAAKGGGTTGSPWIALASVNGANAASTAPTLGASVKFAAGYPTGTKNPWVSVTCWQNGVMVYGEGNTPSSSFLLGGASSSWLSAGGSASCSAELGDLYWRGGHEYYTYLATTSFNAGG